MVEKQRKSKGKKMNLHVLSFTVAYFKYSVSLFNVGNEKMQTDANKRVFIFFIR